MDVIPGYIAIILGNTLKHSKAKQYHNRIL